MTSTKSSSPVIYSMAAIGVDGLSATPAWTCRLRTNVRQSPMHVGQGFDVDRRAQRREVRRQDGRGDLNSPH